MSDSEQKPVLLVNLVIARLKEDWPGRDVIWLRRVGSDVYDFYIDYTWIGEIYCQEVRMWTPIGKDPRHVLVKCHAADPDFFRQVCNTTKTIMDRHIRLAEDGLRSAEYFNW